MHHSKQGVAPRTYIFKETLQYIHIFKIQSQYNLFCLCNFSSFQGVRMKVMFSSTSQSNVYYVGRGFFLWKRTFEIKKHLVWVSIFLWVGGNSNWNCVVFAIKLNKHFFIRVITANPQFIPQSQCASVELHARELREKTAHLFFLWTSSSPLSQSQFNKAFFPWS